MYVFFSSFSFDATILANKDVYMIGIQTCA